MRSERERKHARQRGPRSCTKRPSRAIAMTPTNHPERRLRAVYMRERETVRARAPVISEKIVRLQAQLSEHAKERELRLALHGPIEEKGRPRKSRACELTVRSPGRPWPPASKRTLPLKKYKSRDSSRDLYFLRNPEPQRFPPNPPQFFPILFGKHQQIVCI